MLHTLDLDRNISYLHGGLSLFFLEQSIITSVFLSLSSSVELSIESSLGCSITVVFRSYYIHITFLEHTSPLRALALAIDSMRKDPAL